MKIRNKLYNSFIKIGRKGRFIYFINRIFLELSEIFNITELKEPILVFGC
jgi:hypothetical protein